MTTPPPTIAFLGHHKCGTRYLLRIIKQICGECGLRLQSYSNSSSLADGKALASGPARADMLAITNAEWPQVAKLGNLRAFHVIRDPRDVWVSAYFSHLNSHEIRGWEQLSTHRKTLSDLTQEAGLMEELAFSHRVFQAMLDWPFDRENILELRFESLIEEPEQQLGRAFAHLGLLGSQTGPSGRAFHALHALCNWPFHSSRGRIPLRWPTRKLPPVRLNAIIHGNRFEKLSGGRKPGEENTHHHFRRGIPGDWRNHLTPSLLQAFNSRYPGLLQKTGYGE